MAPAPWGYSESGYGMAKGTPSRRAIDWGSLGRKRRHAGGIKIYRSPRGPCPPGYGWRAIPLPPSAAKGWGQSEGYVCVPLHATSRQMAETGFDWGTLVAGVGSLIGELFSGGDDTAALQAQLAAQQQQLVAYQQAQAQKPAVPIWVWVGGGGLVLYLLLRPRK